MSDTNIMKALHAHFMTWAGDTNLPDKTILENDGTFDPETADTDLFYRCNTIFANGGPTMIGAFTEGGEYRVVGEFRVIVSVKRGSGVITGSLKADSVKNHFNRGRVLTEGVVAVKIEKAYRQTGVPSGNYYHIPVCIEFWVYQSYQP